MIRICAWCKTILEHTADAPIDGETHGICEQCWDNLDFQQGVPLDHYLDALNMPIAVVNAEGRIADMNTAARRIVGKSLEAISGHFGGDVFECKYARLPGGCGKTVHCSGCAIRQTVEDTLNSGQPHFRVPAVLNSLEAESPIYLYVTTRKDGDVVLLHIEFAVIEGG